MRSSHLNFRKLSLRENFGEIWGEWERDEISQNLDLSESRTSVLDENSQNLAYTAFFSVESDSHFSPRFFLKLPYSARTRVPGRQRLCYPGFPPSFCPAVFSIESAPQRTIPRTPETSYITTSKRPCPQRAVVSSTAMFFQKTNMTSFITIFPSKFDYPYFPFIQGLSLIVLGLGPTYSCRGRPQEPIPPHYIILFFYNKIKLFYFNLTYIQIYAIIKIY